MSRLWKAHRGPSEALLFFLSVWLLYLPIALSTCTSTLPRCQVKWEPTRFSTSSFYFYLCLSPDLPLVSGCLGVHIRILSAVHQHFYLFIFSISSPASSFSSHSHKQTDTHSLTQLISPSHAHSSSRMWPCLIVYHAHLFSLRDVTIAYLFSSGLPSHIKMIDSFHSLHIFKLYLISSFPLAFKFLLFPCLKVIMLPRHVIIHSRDCFFS